MMLTSIGWLLLMAVAGTAIGLGAVEAGHRRTARHRRDDARLTAWATELRRLNASLRLRHAEPAVVVPRRSTLRGALHTGQHRASALESSRSLRAIGADVTWRAVNAHVS